MKHFLKIRRDQMGCQYCNNTCVKGIRERKRYWWWECKNCKVNFLASLKGTIEAIEYESKEENGKFYTIHILLKQNRSDIFVWERFINFNNYFHPPKDKNKQSYTSDFVISFNQLLEITPENFEKKLKTYLLLL